MGNFFTKFSTKYFSSIALIVCLFFPYKSLAQGAGAAYCVPEGTSIPLSPIAQTCSGDWTVTLENFCLFSSGCAQSNGLFDFTVTSSEIMTYLRIDLEDIFGDEDLASIVIPNSTTFDLSNLENIADATPLEPLSTTNNIGDYMDIDVMNVDAPDSNYGNKYNIRFKISTESCENVEFYIPYDSGITFCSDSGECIGTSFDTEDTVGELFLSNPSDYPAVYFNYNLDMPPCENESPNFTPLLVGGGGCEENGGNWSITVNFDDYEIGETSSINANNGDDVFILIQCEDTELECGDIAMEEIIIMSNYDIDPTISQVSCINANDGSISLEVTDLGDDLDNNGDPLPDPTTDDQIQTNLATYNWYIIDPETDNPVSLGTTQDGQPLGNNEWGITGEGSELNELPGSYDGIEYHVFITVNSCEINDGNYYNFYVFEPEALSINSEFINHDLKECNYDISCHGESDGKLTLGLPGIIEGGTFSQTALDYGADNDGILVPDNSDLSNYSFQLYEGTTYIPGVNIEWQEEANNDNIDLIIDDPETNEPFLSVGWYTLVLLAPDGQAGDGVCPIDVQIEITEPEPLELSFVPNDDDNDCYGDTNGYIDWTSITGGCPFPSCVDNNNAVSGFGGCVDAVNAVGCNYTFNGYPISDWCPETCGTCPDLLFEYEVIITNLDTEDEFNPLSDSLPAGNYLVTVTDANGCVTTDNFLINQPNPIELTNDIDGDGIINGAGLVTIYEYTGYNENGEPYNISCCGEEDGQIIIDIDAMNDIGTPPFTLKLFKNNTLWAEKYSNLDTNEEGNLIFDNSTVSIGIPAGDYTLQILDAEYVNATDTEYCSAETDFTLIEPNCLEIETIPSTQQCGYNISCNGEIDGWINTETLGGTGSYTYTWFELEVNEEETGFNQSYVGNSSTLNDVGAGTYLVLLNDGNFCTIQDTITLFEPPLLTVDLTQENVSCFGGGDGSITLTINGGCPNIIDNYYEIVWTDENGEIIPIENTPDLNTETGSVTSTIENIGAGNYSVDITDGNGCEIFDETIIIEPLQDLFVDEEVSNYNGYGVSCNGAEDGSISLDITGGTFPYDIEWTNSEGAVISNNENISDLSAGTYSVTVTDQNECFFTIEFEEELEITESEAMAISAELLDYTEYGVSCFGGM